MRKPYQLQTFVVLLTCLCFIPLLVRPQNTQSLKTYANVKAFNTMQVQHTEPQTQSRSLLSVLKELEKKYAVHINYNLRFVKGKSVDLNWNSTEAQNIEESLNIVLKDLNLTFRKLKKNYYLIYSTQKSLSSKGKAKRTSNKALNQIENLPPKFTSKSRELQTLQIEFQDIPLKTISGTVIDDQNVPLPGVSIVVKGTTTGTVTDTEGNYNLNVPDDKNFLIFSSVGYISQEVEIGAQTTINVTMASDLEVLEEVVVIGYGTQKKEDLTGSVSQIGSEDIDKFTYNQAAQALQGKMAGVRVEANGGAPGANSIVVIRGTNSLSDRGPLYVIDGVWAGNMDMLNPGDIESVSVLKDASATAIYGSRGANGVVIVTTKKGKAGRTNIDFDISYGTTEVINRIDWANARQYADIVNRANDNDGEERFPANDALFNPNNTSDIQDATLKSAPIFNASLRASGGSKNLTYNVSGSHYERQGVVRQSAFERSTVRAFTTFHKGRFRLENSIGLTRTVNNPNNYFNRERDLIPTIRLRDDNGNFSASDAPDGVGIGTFYGVSSIGNSLGLATVEDRTVTRNTLIGSLIGSFEIIEGLNYKLNLSLNYFNNNNYTFTPTFMFSAADVARNDLADLNEINNTFLSTLIEHTLNFKRQFGKHNVEALVGYTDQLENNRSLGANVEGFPSNEVRVASAAEVFNDVPSQDITEGRRSVFGRVNYIFDSRYILTASIRRDESSRFKDGNRVSTFPSFAIGWNINNEPFMANATFISNLKLRGGYGESGSDNVDPYSGDPVLNLNSEYILGTDQTRRTGYSITEGVNPNLIWETTRTTNIGLEFGILEGKLNFTLDYFVKNTSDVLAEIQWPLYTGFNNRIPFNTVDISNKGFEMLVNYNNTFGDLKVSASANLSLINNEVTDLGQSGPITNEGGFTSNGLRSIVIDEGQPIGSFFGYMTDGIYQSDAEADQANDQIGNPRAGDLRFKDLDGDGMITDEDQTFLGNGIPTTRYGLSINMQYKGFDLNMVFNGVAGNELLNANLYRGFFDTDGNYLAAANNAWTSGNTNTNIPRNTRRDPGFNRRVSDFYLENGAYFRLRNVQIGYSLPKELLEKIFVQRLRIYVSAENLFTITNYTGYYPELGRNGRGTARVLNAGIDENVYPASRIYQMGLQLSF